MTDQLPPAQQAQQGDMTPYEAKQIALQYNAGNAAIAARAAPSSGCSTPGCNTGNSVGELHYTPSGVVIQHYGENIPYFNPTPEEFVAAQRANPGTVNTNSPLMRLGPYVMPSDVFFGLYSPGDTGRYQMAKSIYEGGTGRQIGGGTTAAPGTTGSVHVDTAGVPVPNYGMNERAANPNLYASSQPYSLIAGSPQSGWQGQNTNIPRAQMPFQPTGMITLQGMNGPFPSYAIPTSSLATNNPWDPTIINKAASDRALQVAAALVSGRAGYDPEFGKSFLDSAKAVDKFEAMKLLAGNSRDAWWAQNQEQKAAENLNEWSRAYHEAGQQMGIPVAANPYEAVGDTAVEMLKGTPTQLRDTFSPLSGDLLGILPMYTAKGGATAGLGLQQDAWNAAIAREHGKDYSFANFGLAATYLSNKAKEGWQGPYGDLYGGQNFKGTIINAPLGEGVGGPKMLIAGYEAPLSASLGESNLPKPFVSQSLPAPSPAVVPPSEQTPTKGSDWFGNILRSPLLVGITAPLTGGSTQRSVVVGGGQIITGDMGLPLPFISTSAPYALQNDLSDFGGMGGGLIGHTLFGRKSPEVMKGLFAAAVSDATGGLIKLPVKGATENSPYGEFSRWSTSAGQVVMQRRGYTEGQLQVYGQTLENKPANSIQDVSDRLSYGFVKTMSLNPGAMASGALAGVFWAAGGEAVGGTTEAIAGGGGRLAPYAAASIRLGQSNLGTVLPLAAFGVVTIGSAADWGKNTVSKTIINLGADVPGLTSMGVSAVGAQIALRSGIWGFQTQKEIQTIDLRPTIDLRETFDLTTIQRPSNVASLAEQAMIMRQYDLSPQEISMAKTTGASLNDILHIREMESLSISSPQESMLTYDLRSMQSPLLDMRQMYDLRSTQSPEIYAFAMSKSSLPYSSFFFDRSGQAIKSNSDIFQLSGQPMRTDQATKHDSRLDMFQLYGQSTMLQQTQLPKQDERIDTFQITRPDTFQLQTPNTTSGGVYNPLPQYNPPPSPPIIGGGGGYNPPPPQPPGIKIPFIFPGFPYGSAPSSGFGRKRYGIFHEYLKTVNYNMFNVRTGQGAKFPSLKERKGQGINLTNISHAAKGDKFRTNAFYGKNVGIKKAGEWVPPTFKQERMRSSKKGGKKK